MSRIIVGGTLVPGGFTRMEWFSTTVFNPLGDWDTPPWTLAHPRSAGAELVTFDHGKTLIGTRFRYRFSIRHVSGTATATFDVDHS